MVSLNSIEVSYGSETVLKDVSFIINRTEKVALTGRNGAGKSTLLKIINGNHTPTKGSVSIQNDIKIGYLPQQMPVADTTTLIKETEKAFSDNLDLQNRLDRLNRQLSEREDYESQDYENLLMKIEDLNMRLAVSGSADMQAEMEQTLTGLGFKKSDFNRPTSEFSGGWRMRVELAKILLRKPDILLLDEPTNHLDIESIQWLENFLKQKKITLMLVSHDKAFLDNVTTRTIEIECGRTYDYKVPYSQYQRLREERLEQQRRAYENQQKQIADIKEFIERFRYKATKAVQVQSRIKQLEKIVPIEIDETDTSSLSLKFPPAKRSGDYPLILENVGKNYGDLNVFSGAEFNIRRGEKVAFVGKNGEGKTTMVRCIMNQVPFEGSIRIGHNVDIGYFAQNEAQLLDESLTVFETVDNVAVGEIRTRLKDLLAAFLFRGQDIDKKVSVLSGGEKTRLAMIKLLLKPANLLIMDEPTNHLDIATKEILKNALRQFDGTLILVSHDRDFLDGVVEKIYEFGDKRVTEHLGGVYDFLEKKKIDDFRSLEKGTPSVGKKDTGTQNPSTAQDPKEDAKTNYLKQKEAEKIRKRNEKAIARIEQEISGKEALLAALEEKIAGGDASESTLMEYSDCKNSIDSLMEEWEQAQENLN